MSPVICRQAPLHEILPEGSRERLALRSAFVPRLAHGGPESKGRRKTKRPYREKAPVHILLSSDRARGAWSLSHRRSRSRVQSMVFTFAERFKIRVHRVRIEGGRIHLLVQSKERKNLADFLRVLAGRVAVVVSGAKKGVRRIGKFWNELCWSKLVNWGSEFHSTLQMIKGGAPNAPLVPESPLEREPSAAGGTGIRQLSKE